MHRRTIQLSTVLLFFVAFVLAAGLLVAQKMRTVEGTVLDADDNAIPHAIVYLKNEQSRAVRTYIAGDDGRYDFHALDPNVDYQLYAQWHGTKSSTRMVSSFNSESTIHLDLKIPIGH